MAMKDYAYNGKGRWFFRVKGAAAALVEVGIVTEATFSVDEEEKSVPEMRYAGGGKANSFSRVTAVKFEFTVLSHAPDVLAMALRAVKTDVTAAAVVDEPHTAYIGGYVGLDVLPDLTVAPVVKDATAVTTYVKDTDYELANGGIVILSGGAINDGDTVKISYTKLASHVFEALAASALEYEMVFDGLNEFDSGAPTVINIHRAKFAFPSSFGVVSDDAVPIQIGGELLTDSTITGSTLSKFFKVRRAA